MKKIVHFTACPIDQFNIRTDQEHRDIRNRIACSIGRNRCDIEHVPASRLEDVYRSLLKYNPHIVQFSCHGMNEGIVLENVNGYSKILKSKPLAKLLGSFKDRGLECVVLNYCFSKNQARILSKDMDYVVGIKNTISDNAAIEWAVAFYDGLGVGESYEFSFDLARNVLQCNNSKEDKNLILFVNGKIYLSEQKMSYSNLN